MTHRSYLLPQTLDGSLEGPCVLRLFDGLSKLLVLPVQAVHAVHLETQTKYASCVGRREKARVEAKKTTNVGCGFATETAVAGTALDPASQAQDL